MKPAKSVLRDNGERRRHPRKGCVVEAKYRIGDQEFFGRLVDISLGGLCLETTRSHLGGEPVEVSLMLFPQRGWPVVVTGTVAKVALQDDGRWWIGIALDELTPAAHKDIAFYVLN